MPNNSYPRIKSLTSSLSPTAAYIIFTPPKLASLLQLEFLPHPDEFTAIITHQDCFLLHNNLSSPSKSNNSKIKSIILTKDFRIIDFLATLHPTISTLHLEPTTPQLVFDKFASLHKFQLDFDHSRLGNLISLKTQQEIDNIKIASKIAASTMTWIKSHLKPGISEKHLAYLITKKMISLGAQTVAFDSIVAFGPHSSIPHHHPTTKKLNSSDIILIDIGAKFNNQSSDMSRTFLPKSASTLMHQIEASVSKAYHDGILFLKTSTPKIASHLDQVVRNSITKDGFGNNFIHSTGHGVGYDIHEHPHISPSSSDTLHPSQIITLEPGLYFPKKFGYRYENTLQLTASNILELTQEINA